MYQKNNAKSTIYNEDVIHNEAITLKIKQPETAKHHRTQHQHSKTKIKGDSR